MPAKRGSVSGEPYNQRPMGTGSAACSLRLTLPSRTATVSLGRTLGRALRGGEVLGLIGELGAGKTALVKGIAEGLNVPASAVTSPTFVLIHEYQGRMPLIHVDLYRLRSPAEAETLGLHEYFHWPAVTVIEWADRFPALLPEDHLVVRLTHGRSTVRRAHLSALGDQAVALLARIADARQLRHSPKHRPKPQAGRKARR